MMQVDQNAAIEKRVDAYGRHPPRPARTVGGVHGGQPPSRTQYRSGAGAVRGRPRGPSIATSASGLSGSGGMIGAAPAIDVAGNRSRAPAGFGFARTPPTRSSKSPRHLHGINAIGVAELVLQLWRGPHPVPGLQDTAEAKRLIAPATLDRRHRRRARPPRRGRQPPTLGSTTMPPALLPSRRVLASGEDQNAVPGNVRDRPGGQHHAQRRGRSACSTNMRTSATAPGIALPSASRR